MHWIVDAQLPPALARWLAARGHSAEHVADAGLLEATDSTIWAYAGASRAVLVSKDEDFVTLLQLRPNGAALVWVRLGNTTRPALIEGFERALPHIEAALARGESLVEVV